MELNFHVNGAERKRLVQTISNWRQGGIQVHAHLQL